jgi:hypothetical protein
MNSQVMKLSDRAARMLAIRAPQSLAAACRGVYSRFNWMRAHTGGFTS